MELGQSPGIAEHVEESGTSNFPAFAGHSEWAMLGSNQRPLPCEGSKVTAAIYSHIPKVRVNKPTWRLKHTSLLRPLPPFYSRVAARLLHGGYGLHPHKVRDDPYSTRSYLINTAEVMRDAAGPYRTGVEKARTDF
jgi:hypothetical protein